MKKIICLIAVLAILGGCQQKSGDNQKLYEEVMAVHDAVMPKMDDIYKLKRQLKEQLSSNELGEDRRQTIEQAIKDLDAASEGMMDWMRNFNPLPDSIDQEKARDYLLAEKERIQQVKEEMLKSINTAQDLQ